jgi:hypothetical protein
MLVCPRDTCFEGPQEKEKQYGSDDIGPEEQYHL